VIRVVLALRITPGWSEKSGLRVVESASTSPPNLPGDLISRI
jgi:hypothetical protein